MNATDGHPNQAIASLPRQRDRRRGFSELLATMSRGIGHRTDPSLLRGAFEESLRKMLSVRTVHLRDTSARWAAEAGPTAIESIAFEVPGPSPRTRGVLEATFDPECRPGEWDFQMLGIAAHLGALVLELERARIQTPRSEMAPPARPKSDGAAPLIGSTPGDDLPAGADRAGRGHGLHGPAGRGVWIRQGARGAPHSRAERPASWSVRSDQLRGPGRNAARGRALRHRRKERPLACEAAGGNSSMRTAARCSWTRCPTCRSRRRPSCCAPFRTCRSNEWAAMAPAGWTSASWPPPTGAWPASSSAGCFARSVLPSWRRRHPRPAAARTSSRHSRAVVVLPRAPQADEAAAAVAARPCRCCSVQLAGQRPRARASYRACRGARGGRRHRDRRPAAGHRGDYGEILMPSFRRARNAARVGVSLRAPRPRPLQGQQARSRAGVGNQLPHPHGVSEVVG